MVLSPIYWASLKPGTAKKEKKKRPQPCATAEVVTWHYAHNDFTWEEFTNHLRSVQKLLRLYSAEPLKRKLCWKESWSKGAAVSWDCRVESANRALQIKPRQTDLSPAPRQALCHFLTLRVWILGRGRGLGTEPPRPLAQHIFLSLLYRWSDDKTVARL